VDELPEPQPIEIELTSNEAARERRSPRRHDVPGTPATPGPDDGPERPPAGVLATERGRLLLTTMVVGVVALVLGWTVGRSAGPDVDVTRESVPVTTTVTPTTELRGERLPAVESEPESPPRTTTTLPEIEVDRMVVDPRLAGLAIELVGADRSGNLLELDLATSELRTRRMRRTQMEPLSLVVGVDWVVMPRPEISDVDVIFGDGEPIRTDLGEPWQLLWVPGTDRFWRGEGTGPFGPSGYEEVDVHGELTGAQIDTAGAWWIVAADPNGGLMTVQAGRTYVIDERGARLIADGELMALDASFVVYQACDDALVCSMYVADRTTGAISAVPNVESIESRIEPFYYWGGQRSNAISPDGRWCVVTWQGPRSMSSGLLDLESGELRELGSTDYPPPRVAWSPDGRFAFFPGQTGRLSAYDVERNEIVIVSEGMPAWTDVSVRPVVDPAV
jgi:hypothetical protein